MPRQAREKRNTDITVEKYQTLKMDDVWTTI